MDKKPKKLTNLEKDAKADVCPECGSEDIKPIIYGLPGPELQEKAIEGKVRLGGCIFSAGSPNNYCEKCGKRWK